MDIAALDPRRGWRDTVDTRAGTLPRFVDSGPPALDTLYALTPAGERELHGRVTTLPLHALELLLRLDGKATLSQVRAAMARLDDLTFDAAVRTLVQRKLIQESQPDHFDAMSTQQLHMLSWSLGDAAALKPAKKAETSFSVGLVRKRPTAPLRMPGMPRAVVVEDDPALARFVECFLALEGLQVTLAGDRAAVVAALRTPPMPAVVLLDGTLPDADGFDVLAKLREHTHYRDVPVIMLTARATREAVLQAICSGADGYLTKPFDAEVLVNAVRAVTGLNGGAYADAGHDPWVNHDARQRRT